MIIGLFGNLGRGKTLGMTMLGHKFKQETNLDNVVTNYHTDITTHSVTSGNELEKISQEVEGIYLLDEIWAWMNSREAMENDEMIDMVINSRKRGCLIIYTVQNPSMVDNILTGVTDYIGIPKHFEAHETDYSHDLGVLDLFDANSYEHVNKYKYNAETFYNTYDTSQEVSSVSDVKKYSDVLDDMIKAFKVGKSDTFQCGITDKKETGFTTKTEAISFLELHTDLSHSKKEAVVTEAQRQVENENNTNSDSNDSNSSNESKQKSLTNLNGGDK